MPGPKRSRRKRTDEWQSIQQWTLWPEQELYERMREERKRQCKIQPSDRRKLAGYLPLVETSKSTAWASVQCASLVRANGDHRQTSKKPSQSCAAPLTWPPT